MAEYIYLRSKDGAKCIRFASESESAAELEAAGWTRVSKEEYWGEQSPATLQHFVELEELDPTALSMEEETLVKELLEKQSEPGDEESAEESEEETKDADESENGEEEAA